MSITRHPWCPLLPVALCVALVQCTHTVNVGLQPGFEGALARENELVSVRPPLSFRRGTYADKRSDTTRLGEFQQGVHTYNLYAERPIQDAVFEGLENLVTGSGQVWSRTNTADVRIDLELLNMDANRHAGLIKVGASSHIQIRLDFVDAAGHPVYAEIYNGADERSHAVIGSMSMVKESINAAIVNCLNAVGKDAKLARALQEAHANTGH